MENGHVKAQVFGGQLLCNQLKTISSFEDGGYVDDFEL